MTDEQKAREEGRQAAREGKPHYKHPYSWATEFKPHNASAIIQAYHDGYDEVKPSSKRVKP